VNTYTDYGIINTWLKGNYVSIYFKIHLKTRNSPFIDMKIGLDNKLLPNTWHHEYL